MPMQKMIVALYSDNTTIKDSVLYVNNQTFPIANEDKNGLIELNYSKTRIFLSFNQCKLLFLQ